MDTPTSDQTGEPEPSELCRTCGELYWKAGATSADAQTFIDTGRCRACIDKSPGQRAYEQDVRQRPTYDGGIPRKAWADLPEYARWSWERGGDTAPSGWIVVLLTADGRTVYGYVGEQDRPYTDAERVGRDQAQVYPTRAQAERAANRQTRPTRVEAVTHGA